RAVGFLHAVDAADVRVTERGEDLRFTLETCDALAIEREQLGERRYRDVSVQRRVAGAVYVAHSAFTQLPDNDVGTDALDHLDVRGSRVSARPPAPSVAVISYGPMRLPGESVIDWRPLL